MTNLTKNLKIYNVHILGGNWGEWSGFSDCSVTCGVCLKSRKRKCSSKINDFLEVAPCVGKETETESSQLKPCLSASIQGNSGTSGWNQIGPQRNSRSTAWKFNIPFNPVKLWLIISSVFVVLS